MKILHPARTLPIDTLIDSLNQEIANRNVIQTLKGNLAIYCYTQHCIYQGNWTEITRLARGLIIDIINRELIATPFPKFFNWGEKLATIPDEDFSIYEKLDGSLGIVYFYQGQWCVATKGSFNSPPAQLGQILLKSLKTEALVKGYTYLFEILWPANPIVIKYPHQELVLLSAYTPTGEELNYSQLEEIALKLGTRVVKSYPSHSLEALQEICSHLPREQEGFVVRFSDGTRVKLKGQEYLLLHRSISNLTPLNIWEMLKHELDINSFKENLPEEHWEQFDTIALKLQAQFNQILNQIQEAIILYEHLDNRSLAASELDPKMKGFIFNARKSPNWQQEPRIKDKIWRMIRPVANLDILV
ncbi:Aldehyde dehydrogenase, conserved site [Gloeothece citriformis PCC 7424]|uniref:Aldehyde dehydrogenase, conserved site n=1 Tax=Gloeothece citriformis (strain PCC 7424) TaxID=65393 RepID=B7KJ16_GLOC7|nr:T4 RnlA family RNA ligase [Gloeothece citriformis]ACK70852.1 Aldehyde dehydrogenase, conserved site [Gloeothece citriformis PCC 7424]